MPMLTVAKTSWPSMVKRLAQRRMDPLRDRDRVARARSMSSSRIVNSSPPRRATVSPGERSLEPARDARRAGWSPAMWPRLSLTTLKRSTSRKSTANRPSVAARVAPQTGQRRRRRSMKRARLGRPVSESWKASWRSRSSARRRSVTSAPMEAIPETSPRPVRSTVLFQATSGARRGGHDLVFVVGRPPRRCMRSEDRPPRLPILLRHEGVEPVAADHVLLFVAEQLQNVGVGEGDVALASRSTETSWTFSMRSRMRRSDSRMASSARRRSVTSNAIASEVALAPEIEGAPGELDPAIVGPGEARAVAEAGHGRRRRLQDAVADDVVGIRVEAIEEGTIDELGRGGSRSARPPPGSHSGRGPRR